VAARLKVKVFVVSSGSRPIRPPGMSNVSMVLVGDTADAADDWIAARVGPWTCASLPISRWPHAASKRGRASIQPGEHGDGRRKSGSQ
jgi:hypothetical protein